MRTVAAGDALLDPAVTRELVRLFVEAPSGVPSGVSRWDGGNALGALTEREAEVLRLVAEGFSNAEIAGRLFIAESTAKTHVKRILAKVGARDRAQAVVIAYRSGLMRRPGGTPGR